jgi:hypothetical protein
MRAEIRPLAVILILGVLAAAVVVGAAAEGRLDWLAQQAYQPPSLRNTWYTCDWGAPGQPTIHKISVTDADRETWYATMWRAAHEPSLYMASRSQAGGSLRTYRFTWLRSFHAPVVVRIDAAPDGALHLVATRMTGEGGYGPGSVAARIERPLTAREADAFAQKLQATHAFELPPVDCHSGVDGAQWILEANDHGTYRYVDRWTPETGPVRDVGLLMLGFTGWRLDPVY